MLSGSAGYLSRRFIVSLPSNRWSGKELVLQVPLDRAVEDSFKANFKWPTNSSQNLNPHPHPILQTKREMKMGRMIALPTPTKLKNRKLSRIII